MANKQFGKKRTCTNCGKNFYDLNNTPPKCPSCEFVFEKKISSRAKIVPGRSTATPSAKENAETGSIPNNAAEKNLTQPETGRGTIAEKLSDNPIDDGVLDDAVLDDAVLDNAAIDDTVIEDTSSIDGQDTDVSEVKEQLEIENTIKD